MARAELKKKRIKKAMVEKSPKRPVKHGEEKGKSTGFLKLG